MPVRLLVFVAMLLMVLSGSALAGPFSALYALGDSQTDSGNVAFLNPGATYPSGRFSDGPVWIEYLAELMGKHARPSLTGGTNFAFGGARIDSYGTIGPVPSLQEQAAALLTQLGNSLPPNALFVVWGGANDVGDALEEALSTGNPLDPAELPAAVSALDGILRGMAAAGAVNFLVPNLGDLGLTPKFAAAAGAATDATVAFNDLLAAMLDELLFELPGLNLTALDFFGLSWAVAADPDAYGFTNTTEACLTTAACNPDEFLFWDDLHFTTAAHAILGKDAYDAVPLPAPLVLMLTGLVALAAARRRHIR
jgi:phospholipase/lecithinase/hemolysin